MSGLKLTQKKVKVAVRNGQTLEEFAEKIGKSVEESKTMIDRLYSADKSGKSLREIYSGFESNGKKHRKTKATKPIKVEATETETPAVEEPAEKTLADLRKEEEELSQKVCNLEAAYKEQWSKRHACIEEMRDLQDEIEVIKINLMKCHAKYEKTATKADAYAEVMNGISTQKSQEEAKLEKLREEIEEKNTIILMVQSDGTIETDENSEFVLNDEGYLEVRADIEHKDECLDLTQREIITLARLIKICSEVEKPSLLCENPKLEEAFWALR